MRITDITFLFLSLLYVAFCQLNTGFWYGGDRPPETRYDTVPYANMTVRVNRNYHDGPGDYLITDPYDTEKLIFAGNTIHRQAFDTQFVLDLSNAIGIDQNRVYVINVAKGKVHYSWESTNVIVTFIFLERNQTNGMTLLEAIAELTNQIQQPESMLYAGKVTTDIDQSWGVAVRTWDVSIKLTYDIRTIGGDAVIDGYYLNQGSLGLCDQTGARNVSQYCEFERFFEDDVSRALSISYYRVQILFIKSAAEDAVLVDFRIMPPLTEDNTTFALAEDNVTVAVANLWMQVADQYSDLYKGNVTIRTDPTWGVSKQYRTVRPQQAKFTLQYYEQDQSRLNNTGRAALVTAYDRCKANRRCNWGIVEHNQSTNDARFFQRLFERGTLYKTNLFLDFEDWRMGSRGFSWNGYIPPSYPGSTSIPKARAENGVIRGAKFSPFGQRALGPTLPCYLTEENQGLVLDKALHRTQIDKQEALIDDLRGRIDWTIENIEFAQMDSIRRSRKDVLENQTKVMLDYKKWHDNEVVELKSLNVSQCIEKVCSIQFNTSSLLLTGAIEDVGEIKLTSEGTEVAVFTFNSIYIGPETEVIVVGQRALSLLSRTTAFINTTIIAAPGTIGGFQGGGSVARYQADQLSDTPRPIFICDLGSHNTSQYEANEPVPGRRSYCNYNVSLLNNNATQAEKNAIVTNNVNGPGSGNVRINPFVILTSGTYIQEVQVIKTFVQAGQTISGGFTLSYNGYATPIIPYDASALQLKNIMEDNLNLISPASASQVPPVFPDRGNGEAGIGAVSVSRSVVPFVDGYTWSITFTTAIGNVDTLNVTSYLFGTNVGITLETATEGNELGGHFLLEFQGVKSAEIPPTTTADQLTDILLDMPMVTTAVVRRTDPTENCDDGLCPYGPFPTRGLLWTVYITTDLEYDNVSPNAPSSSLALEEDPYYRFIPINRLTGQGAAVDVTYGTADALENPMNLLSVTYPFSLAFGGAGGSYGGYGGKGYGINPTGPLYNDKSIKDLLGGSGGCMKLDSPYTINALLGPSDGVGGHGGGAIEIIAANDLTIGSYGKISVRGQAGQQSTIGGGGGGSGGAISLSSGATIVMEGELDATGGDGGFGGFEHLDKAGGGGGGGRIALFADSITVPGKVSVAGGRCGIYTREEYKESIVFNIGVYTVMRGWLSNDRRLHLGELFLRETFSSNVLYVDTIEVYEEIVNAVNVTQDQNTEFIHTILNYSITVDVSEMATDEEALAKYLENIVSGLDATKGMIIGDVDHLEAIIVSMNSANVTTTTYTDVGACTNDGDTGSYYTEAKMTTAMYVSKPADSGAAEGTQRALFMSNRESTTTISGSPREAPFSWNGPILPFEASRPSRITYYTKTDATENGDAQKADFGTLFSLVSRGEAGLNISSVIGVFMGSKIMHGANFGSAVDEKVFLKRMVTIGDYPILDRWYKVDIKIQWDNHTYSISIDDLEAISKQPFKGDDLDGIRLSVWRSVDVWFDEIYVGFDNTMEFNCPVTLRTGTSTAAPVQRRWSYEEVHGEGTDGYTAYYEMTRHYNFLDTAGSIPFDGQGAIKDNQDIKGNYADGDYPDTQGKIHAGALVYLTNSLRSGKTPLDASKTLVSPKGLWSGVKDGIGGAGDGRQFWYTEYNYESDLTATLNGGVAACSSQDLIKWRFEGIVFHYTNLSDTVFGSEAPFYVERPKVLFNAPTNSYVMWAVMDNNNRTLGMSMIATSTKEDGPFYFRRAFYPDGNRTRDQVIYTTDEGKAMLGRTYYQTVEFVLPEAIMQPVWENVKDRNGATNYRSNYHRAQYHSGYDNFNDIYLQRWRGEDKLYQVICVNKLNNEEREVASGVSNAEGFICNDPEERKVVIGQGNPIIESKFVSPADANNSWWRPTSVPNVEAQAWSSNYRDGYCGIRKLDDDFDGLDPNLDDFSPTDRSECSNIADNPIHDMLQDKLIGVLRVVNTRRAKFIAISELTFDYLDTSGYVNSFEGELESGDLISMIVEMGQFGFTAGENIQSTFRQPVRSEFDTAVDYKTRFRQYIRNSNDRASYSLACVLDGVCPVNFKDQLQY